MGKQIGITLFGFEAFFLPCNIDKNESLSFKEKKGL